jgi:small subunit ribosomal protein S4
MARYRGPKQKLARRFGEPIFGPSKSLERKPYPPGQHGNARRRKESEYSVQLKEKQKAKHIYGLLERQFSNLFEKAARKKGITGENLLQFLEARLDNVVYRLGFAQTRRQARQLVTHGHVMVNERVSNIPSHQLRPGDLVEVRPKSKQLSAVRDAAARNRRSYPFLEVDRDALRGKLLELPQREDIPENIREQLIVELYSK